MPEDQNTGGFFVALLKKNKKINFKLPTGILILKLDTKAHEGKDDAIDNKETKRVKQNDSIHNKGDHHTPEHQNGDTEHTAESSLPTTIISKKKKERQGQVKSEYHPLNDRGEESWEALKEYYGIQDDVKKNLYTSFDGNNKIFIVNDGLCEFLSMDKKSQLRRINVGTRAFQRCKNKHNGKNIVFRLTQEGVQALFHCFTKRRLSISIDTLMFMVHHTNIRHQDIPEDQIELKQICESKELGYFALLAHKDGHLIELACLLKFGGSIILMTSDENISGLKIKYDNEFADDFRVKKQKQRVHNSGKHVKDKQKK